MYNDRFKNAIMGTKNTNLMKSINIDCEYNDMIKNTMI